MSAYEDSYKSQLQGVSQQVPRERLDGQVSEQLNMLSDPVTNLRRRPGTTHRYDITVGSGDMSNAFMAGETVVGAVKCQVILDTKAGVVRVLDMQDAVVYTSPVVPYLQTTDDNIVHIRHASVGDDMYIVNTTKTPAFGAIHPTVGTTGSFASVVAGSFNTTYTLNLDVYLSGFPPAFYTAAYTTPTGAAVGDAALSTPEYIAEQLRLGLVATVPGILPDGTAFAPVRSGPVVFIPILTRLSSPSGLQYIVTTVEGAVRRAEDLPTGGPTGMNNFLVKVGRSPTWQYYRFKFDTSEWLESGDSQSPLTLTNMPVALTCSAGVWAVETTPFEGRFAGDDLSSPHPAFMYSGITGLSAYQGRLVILAGSDVCLSASRLPKRFYRSTVTSLLDSDTIGIGSTGTSAATFVHAVTYNNDLILFSDRSQAIIPGSNVALTPRTAAVLPTSEYATGTSMCPLQVGRGLLYATPRSAQHFGIMEMMPSGSAEYQYTSSDATQHLPTYLPGECRFAVSSSVSNLALFGSTTVLNSLWVHEYVWSGDEKLQQAWHRWDFPAPVVSAYFSEGSVVLLLRMGTKLVGVRISPHGSRVAVGGAITPYLDCVATCPVVANIMTAPAWLLAAIPLDTDRAKLIATVTSGNMAGTRIPLVYAAGVFTTGLSYPDGSVQLGARFTSAVVPSPPVRKDRKGVRISTNKMTVQRFNVGTNKSGPFTATIMDNIPGEYSDDLSPVMYNSPELGLGAPVLGADTTVVIPARTRADSTVLTLSTDMESEFNLVGLEFVANYHEKLRRA